MSAAEPAEGLAERPVEWMAANRAVLDRMMAEEGSRAIHEEFILAEGGTLPDRQARIERARGAGARAWMRHLARAVEDVWDGAEAGLAERVERWSGAAGERLEALALEERAVAERRGASGDPDADLRDAELIAHCRLFAEALATQAAALGDEAPPEFSRRVAGLARSLGARRREVEATVLAAWGPGPAPAASEPMTAAVSPEPEETRAREAAAVWAHVRVLAEALERALGRAPGGDGRDRLIHPPARSRPYTRTRCRSRTPSPRPRGPGRDGGRA